MNCQEITQKVTNIHRLNAEMAQKQYSHDFDDSKRILKEIDFEIWNRSGECLEAIKKATEQSRPVFDWLDLGINLKNEIFTGNILLPTNEEYAESKKHGFSEILIIPGQIDRIALCQKASEAIRLDLNPDNDRMAGVWNNSSSNPSEYESLMNTEEGRNATCPKQLYTLLVKKEFDGKNAFPELEHKKASEILPAIDTMCQEMKKDDLFIDGLTLEQGVMLLINRYKKATDLIARRNADGQLWGELAEFLSIDNPLLLTKEKWIEADGRPYAPEFLNIWWHSHEMADELQDLRIRNAGGFWGGNDFNAFDRVQLAVYPKSVEEAVRKTEQ